MKKHNSEEPELRIKPRQSTTVAIRVPSDTLESLKVIASERDMSIEALIRLYVGQGLRNDLARSFADHMLQRVAEVLRRHIDSPEEVSTIIDEVRAPAHRESR